MGDIYHLTLLDIIRRASALKCYFNFGRPVMLTIVSVTFLFVFVWGGCSLFKPNPYSDFSVGIIDEEAEETPAAILVGDPQVISRESLINDRLREVAHIEVLLNESRSQSFEPQVTRDLSVIESFAAQLGISFNPAVGVAFERNEEIQSLKADIEVLKLRNELDRLKSLQEESPDDPALSPTNVEPGKPEGITEPSTADIQKRLDEAIAQADAVLKKLTKPGEPAARSRESKIKASPEEQFEDQDSYRAILRQRQTELRLDDVHDADGNALLRLQFAAEVLPGAVKNKFGVLDFEIVPVQASDVELLQLYEDWLVHLMERGAANIGLTDRRSWERIQSILLKKKIVERFLLFDVPTIDFKTNATLVLFSYPGDSDTIIEMIIRGDSYLRDKFQESDLKVAAIDSDTCKITLADGRQTMDYKRALDVQRVKRSLRAVEVFLSIMRQRAATAHVSDAVEYFDELDTWLLNIITDSDTFREAVEKSLIVRGLKRPFCFSADTPQPDSPEAFKKEVTRMVNDKRFWAGQPYTYQARPAQRVQRLSTLASATNSMQLAFSMAATIPGQGIGLDAGAGAARTAVGIAEAVERTPLVVAYTDRRWIKKDDTDQGSSARFGFLFGPKAILDPKKNKLVYRQVAGRYPVYVDVSVPNWWPKFALRTRTAWAGNWHEGTEVLRKTETSRELPVRLPPHGRDYDILTGVMAGEQMIDEFVGIDIEWVRPRVVSRCVGDIEFLVKGKHLWRGSAAFLRGRKHKSLSVLPDMKGISVVFDMQDLPLHPDKKEEATLTVWTNFGEASWRIEIKNTVNGSPCPTNAREGEEIK